MENMSKDAQLELASRTTVLLGVHGSEFARRSLQRDERKLTLLCRLSSAQTD